MVDIEAERMALEADIARTEDQLKGALHRLKEATRREIDVSEHIAESPLKWLAGAFVIGLIFGLRHG